MVNSATRWIAAFVILVFVFPIIFELLKSPGDLGSFKEKFTGTVTLVFGIVLPIVLVAFAVYWVSRRLMKVNKAVNSE